MEQEEALKLRSNLESLDKQKLVDFCVDQQSTIDFLKANSTQIASELVIRMEKITEQQAKLNAIAEILRGVQVK